MQEAREISQSSSNSGDCSKSLNMATHHSMFRIAINFGMIFAGSVTTIFAKIVEEPIIEYDDEGDVMIGKDAKMTEFKHPLFMNLLMFGGEALLILVFAAKLVK